jgi:transcriptional regulator with XRE-family HTH domain
MSESIDSEEVDLIRDLRNAIRSSGKTMSQLGRAADVNTSSITRFLQGKDLSLSVASRLCRYLKLKLSPAEPKGEAAPAKAPRKGK